MCESPTHCLHTLHTHRCPCFQVAVAAINTDSSGADQTATGDLYLSSLAAVGMPSQPDTPTLTVPAKRVLQVT